MEARRDGETQRSEAGVATIGSIALDAAYALSATTIIGGLFTGRPIMTIAGSLSLEVIFWNTRD